MRHFVLPGKNALLQPPLENSQIKQTIKRVDKPSDCESSCPCYYSQIEGLGLHVVNITRYVIRIKKHLHNRIEIIEIELNRKEYEIVTPLSNL